MADDDVIAFRSPFCVGGIHKVPSDTSPQMLAILERAGFVRLDVPDVDAKPDTFIDELHVHQDRAVWDALNAAPVKRGPGRPRKTTE